MVARTELIRAIEQRLDAMAEVSPGYLEQRAKDGWTVENLADEMAGPLRRRLLQDEMTDALGPYYDSSGLVQRMKVSRQAISKRHLAGSLLGLEADDGRILFPAWQFEPGSADRLRVIEPIAEVREILSERNSDPLSHAIWLTAPVFGDAADPLPAYRLLPDSRGAQIVRSAARAEVLRLAERPARP